MRFQHIIVYCKGRWPKWQADRCVCGEVTVGVRCPAKSGCSVVPGELLGSQEGGWGGRAHQELGRCSVPPLKVSSFTIKMPGNATLEKKMEVSPNSTLGACKAVPVAAAWVVLVRLKGLNEVRTKLSVKEYAVTYFCKVIFF